MKKTILSLMLGIFVLTPALHADEGMWMLMFLDKNAKDMQKKGAKLSAKDIYDINNASLKDAIIQFGRGCTGEIISKEGLVLTNHHCGYGQIQAHSTVEHDYLTNGFWAYSKAEELPNPGLTAKFLVRMEDVTARISKELNKNMTESDRKKKIEEVSKTIKEEAIKGTNYTADVATMFDGNEFYLFIYEIYEDVRLVGAPPSSIGKFGADSDNWMWPRQTGDFSLFRIYMSPDGKPAKYSKDNVPFKPKKYLSVSTSGIKENDFVMIMGYPGTTDRFLTSYGVEMALDIKNPSIVKAREAKLGVMRKHMDADAAVRIQYASKYAQTANYWKYFIGQSKGLRNLDVYGKKKDLENSFGTWVNADPARQAEYGTALKDIQEAYSKIGKTEYFRWYFMECIARGPEILSTARQFTSLAAELKKGGDKTNSIIESLKTSLDATFKDYDMSLDQDMLATCMDVFFRNVPMQYQPEAFMDMSFKNSYDFKKIASDVFSKSIFGDQKKIDAFLKNPTADAIEKDPAFELQKIFFDKYFAINTGLQDANDQLARGNRVFVKGIREMEKSKFFAPNANSTMRLTYGSVLNYRPSDGVLYENYTTLKGVMEKEDSTNWEFVVPAKLKELYKNKDFGPYGVNGVMPVNFIANTDITGGNSGSPMLNAKGHLIGCAFDGNWEAMSGDIAFEPDLQRTIGVDIRYVLFIIDKYAGAKNIINELTLVK